MNKLIPQISICICTYKRPVFLKRLLHRVANQETRGLFGYSIVVVDNDNLRSAESVVREFAEVSGMDVTYCVEVRRNICHARNKAIDNSLGQFVVFIDDDEFPEALWLINLFAACEKYGAVGVLGPVKSYFDEQPPRWVIRGKFYERPSHPTGFVIGWEEGRTGNVLLRKRLFEEGSLPFNPEFHRGGDSDFFRRMTEKGHVFIWCDEAVVFESVPPIRWTRAFMLKRALLRGSITVQSPSLDFISIAKSIVATAAYAAALPFTLVLGQHRFMDVLVRLFDHLGKLLACVGIHPVANPYVTD